MTTAASSRELSVRDAAWLTRVNDDTVRRWFRNPRYPATLDGRERRSTSWDELATYCAAAKRADPLPVELLDIDPGEVRRLLAPDGRGEATDDRTAGLEARLERALLREDGLRRALREQVIATASSQDSATAQRRALMELVDTSEQQRRLDER